MAFDAASVAGTSELALDTGVRALDLVVAYFAAVEAFSGEATASRLVGTLASEVTSLVAA